MPRKKMAPATSNLPDTVPAEAAAAGRAEQAELAARREEVRYTLENLGMPVEYDFHSMVEIVKTAAMQVARGSLILGSALLAIRANESRQRWQEVIEVVGLPERSAFSAMALAREVGKSQSHRKLYDGLGGSRAMTVFRTLTDTQIDELADDEDAIEAIAGKTTREVYAEFQAYRRETEETLEARDQLIAAKDAKLNKQDEQLSRSAAELSDDTKRANELMKAYNTASGEAQAGLTTMQKLADEVYQLRKRLDPTTESRLNQMLGGQVELLARMLAPMQNYGP
jgi:hypothetical protein